jgi:hypothetical protein
MNCSIEDCPRSDIHALGMCVTHYHRVYRTGQPHLSPKKTPATIPLLERLEAKIDRTDTCWLWTGAVNNFGYGQIRRDGKAQYAHRVSYELAHGKIPKGMFLDHTCHVHPCVNPDHLNPVTNKQNLENRRGATKLSQTGIRGVSWDSRRGKYYARVGNAGVHHWLGYFDDAASAEAAAVDARNRLHTNNLLDRV